MVYDNFCFSLSAIDGATSPMGNIKRCFQAVPKRHLVTKPFNYGDQIRVGGGLIPLLTQHPHSAPQHIFFS